MNIRELIERYGLWKVIIVAIAVAALVAVGVLKVEDVQQFLSPYIGG